MIRHIAVAILLTMVFLLSGCKVRMPEEASAAELSSEAAAKAVGESTAALEKDVTAQEISEVQENTLVLIINGQTIAVTWEDNETVDELAAYAQKENIVVDSTRYGGFEQVGSLPQSFERNDVQMTTNPGDIMLYSGNQLVLFFGSNSWSYTKLGHINLSEEELTELLNEDKAVIEINAQK